MGFSVDSEGADGDDDPLWQVALHYQELKSQARAGLLDELALYTAAHAVSVAS